MGKLREKPSSKPILDKGADINLYVAVTAAGYVPGKYGDVRALDFVNHLWALDYENQVIS